MADQIIFAQLRDILVKLYPEEASARRIVDDAGLDSAAISFSTNAKNNWHAILAEADKQGKVSNLLTVTLREYGGNPELRTVHEAYHSLVEQESRVSSDLGDSRADSSREPHRDAEGKDRSRIGIVMAWVLGLLGVGLVAYFAYSGIGKSGSVTPEATQTTLPLVYTMDSMEPAQIYNPEIPGTNTDRIRDILRYLPIEPRRELVHYEWDHIDWMRQWDPDLIIIHASAFYTSTDTADTAKKLDTFLRAMEDRDTRFLIYSRSDDFSNEEGARQTYEDIYPFLQGRVDVLWVPHHDGQNCRFWTCSPTRERLKSKVRSLLGLP